MPCLSPTNLLDPIKFESQYELSQNTRHPQGLKNKILTTLIEEYFRPHQTHAFQVYNPVVFFF